MYIYFHRRHRDAVDPFSTRKFEDSDGRSRIEESQNRARDRAFFQSCREKGKGQKDSVELALTRTCPLSLLVEKHFGKVGRPFRRPSRFCRRKPETLREANIRTLLSIEKRKEKCFSWTKVCHRHANLDIIG